MFFLAIFVFYTLQDFQRYQERLKRSSDEKVMSETKFGGKSGAHSKKISLASKIFARLTNENYCASEIFLIFLIFFFEKSK